MIRLFKILLLLPFFAYGQDHVDVFVNGNQVAGHISKHEVILLDTLTVGDTIVFDVFSPTGRLAGARIILDKATSNRTYRLLPRSNNNVKASFMFIPTRNSGVSYFGCTLKYGFDDDADQWYFGRIEATPPPESVGFRVQIGAFANEVPSEYAAQILESGFDFEPIDEPQTSLVRFVTKANTSLDETKILLEKLKEDGFDSSFIVGDLEGRIISATEAKTLKGIE